MTTHKVSIQSMTGFVSHEHRYQESVQVGYSVVFDLRSLNSRYLELHFRLPEELRFIEAQMRKDIAAQCVRGKIEVRVSVNADECVDIELDRAKLARVLDQQAVVLRVSPAAQTLSVHELLGRCGAPSRVIDSEALGKAVLGGFQDALNGLVAARVQEGLALREIVKNHADAAQKIVVDLTAQLGSLQTRLLSQLQQKAQKICAQLQHDAPLDLADRLSAEVIHHMINGDVAEELSRLTLHLTSLQNLLDQGGAVGKKADFVMQELNREANTLGAKASVLEVTQGSIDLKVKIDQMREQLQNIQ